LASVLSTTEPIFVLVFAYIVNKELATGRELIGAMVAISGLLLLILNG
jgi:drug/metabolite transporter (DMT)-like permease